MRQAAGLLALALAVLPRAALAQQSGWVVFQDPREHAFTGEVPAGWSVVGGLVRPSPGDTRTIVEMRSPDNTMQVGFGDKDLPGFILPSPIYNQLGLREGAPVGNGTVLAAYRSGAAFAAEYGQQVFGRACGHPVQVLQHESNDAFGQQVAQSIGMPGTTGSAGDAVLQCQDPQHGFYGVVAATTLMTPMPNGGFWMVPQIARAAATDKARVQTAVEVLVHLEKTLQIDPQWQAAQNQAAMQALQQRVQPSPSPSGPTAASIQQDLADYRRGVINRTYEHRTAVNDRIAHDMADTMSDTQRLVDPSNGNRFAVPYGYNNYSLAPNGAVVGTMGAEPPGTTSLNKTNN